MAILAEGIAKSLSLVHLDLRSTECRREGAEALFAALLKNETVTCLQMGNIKGLHSNFLAGKAVCLLNVLLRQSAQLTFLDLKGAGIGNDGLAYILEGLKQSKSVRVFNLAFNMINSAGSSLVIEVLANSPIKRLDVSQNALGRAFRVELSKYMQNRQYSLTHLSLSSCGLVSPGMGELFEALRKGPYISVLDLDDTHYEENELPCIKAFLSHNTTVKSFSMKTCTLGDSGARVFAEAFSENCLLEELYLCNNRISVISALKIIGRWSDCASQSDHECEALQTKMS